MRYQIDAACVCNTGLIRVMNEDNFFFFGDLLPIENNGTGKVLAHRERIDSEITLGVYDGIGGGEYGEIASNCAAEATKEFFKKRVFQNTGSVLDCLEEFIIKLNRVVFEQSKELMTRNMGSTMVSLHFVRDRVYACNLGDSKCFRLSGDVFEQLSDDHTDGAYLAANGILNRRPSLIQYLGINPEEMKIEPTIKTVPLHREDRYLLCSDGLTDMVPLSAIKECIQEEDDTAECVKKLLDYALAGGGKDNITIILCTIR